MEVSKYAFIELGRYYYNLSIHQSFYKMFYKTDQRHSWVIGNGEQNDIIKGDRIYLPGIILAGR